MSFLAGESRRRLDRCAGPPRRCRTPYIGSLTRWSRSQPEMALVHAVVHKFASICAVTALSGLDHLGGGPVVLRVGSLKHRIGGKITVRMGCLLLLAAPQSRASH
eukprot:COSAG01_NODE_765_length_13738_cov_21.521870_2_plen_105_part_00